MLVLCVSAIRNIAHTPSYVRPVGMKAVNVNTMTKMTTLKELTDEQKEIIRNADDSIFYLEDRLEEMGSYDEEKAEIEKAIATLKDFTTWSLNNIRERRY